MAEALHLRGLQVSIIQRGAQLMPNLDPDMGELLGNALLSSGIALYRNETVEGFDHTNGLATGVVTDQRTLPADLVILGLGVIPSSGLA